MKAIVLVLLLIPFFAHGSKNLPTPEEFQSLLKLDYKSFDQSLPDGGWRGIVDKVEAGKILDSYLLHNWDKLNPSQQGVIFWHAGQVYAMANLTELAVARFKKSYNPSETAADTFKWNSYVKGSIAFLEHDMRTLVQARDELRAANKIEPNGNLKFIESFVRCFKKTYKEAYDPNCK